MKTSYPKLRRVVWRDGSVSEDAPVPRGEVVRFDDLTLQDLEPDVILEGACGKLSEVLVVGWDQDGDLYVASNHGYRPELLYLLKFAERFLMDLQKNDVLGVG